MAHSGYKRSKESSWVQLPPVPPEPSMLSDADTIAAIATPIGQAGIGIVRVSGPLSFHIARKVFRPRKPHSGFKSHRLYLGYLQEPSSGEIVDEVLLSHMKAPYSYTMEDLVEINSHSGFALLSRILEIVLAQGARLAKPGEFTLRAFLNGRIDLTQAEAIVDLINSKSRRGLRLAAQQIRGGFRKEVEELRQKAIDILAHVELAIDFPEEDTDIVSREEMVGRIQREILRPIDALIDSHECGRVWIDGVSTVIAGRVNAGKSSLLNRLLNEERAIVTPIPGTTRDIIESTIFIEGLPIRLMDTAGLRKVHHDSVEKIGVRMTEQKLAEAELVLVVIDLSRALNEEDFEVIAKAKGKTSLLVLNKIDLPSEIHPSTQQEAFSGFPAVRISALTGEGIEELRKAILNRVLRGDIDTATSQAVPNLRHKKACSEAAQFFRNAEQAIEQEAPEEIIAFELRSGLEALGEIIGETTTEEVLDSIFSQFCIGK